MPIVVWKTTEMVSHILFSQYSTVWKFGIRISTIPFAFKKLIFRLMEEVLCSNSCLRRQILGGEQCQSD